MRVISGLLTEITFSVGETGIVGKGSRKLGKTSLKISFELSAETIEQQGGGKYEWGGKTFTFGIQMARFMQVFSNVANKTETELYWSEEAIVVNNKNPVSLTVETLIYKQFDTNTALNFQSDYCQTFANMPDVDQHVVVRLNSKNFYQNFKQLNKAIDHNIVGLRASSKNGGQLTVSGLVGTLPRQFVTPARTTNTDEYDIISFFPSVPLGSMTQAKLCANNADSKCELYLAHSKPLLMVYPVAGLGRLCMILSNLEFPLQEDFDKFAASVFEDRNFMQS